MRKLLNNVLDWNKLNIEITGSFSDGKSALDFIKNNKTDIVLTDIKMSPMSGLELAKNLNEKFPEICIVVMSAYRDFEYAREAIKYNVHEYILKPITYDEFYNTFSALSDKLSHLNCKSDDIAIPEINSTLILSYVHSLLSAINSNDASSIGKQINAVYNKLDSNISALIKFADCLCSELCSIYGNKIVFSSANKIKFLSKTTDISDIEEIIDELITVAINLHQTTNESKQTLPLIEQAIRYIDEHCHEQITRNDVAKHVSLSSEYFSRYFHGQTNETFSNYLKKVRIRKAKYLLRNTNLKIKEVSLMCGIKKERYFSTLFKQFTGLSPQEYRKKVLNSETNTD